MMLFIGGALFNIAEAAPKITMSKSSESIVEGGTSLVMTVVDRESRISLLKYNWVGASEQNVIPKEMNPLNEVRVKNLIVGNETGIHQLKVTAMNEKGEETKETFLYKVKNTQSTSTNIPEDILGFDPYATQAALAMQKAAFNAYMEDDEPLAEDPVKHYLVFGKPLMGFQSGMSDADIEKWEKIVDKYESGDSSWNMDTNPFRQTGNFSSYIDEDGNLNGWLYAANGIDGYVPVSKGKVMETELRPDTVYYTPDGEAYIVGEDGKLTFSGTVDWARYGEYIGPQAGYHYDGGYFWGTDDDGKLRRYDYATAPKSVLARAGYCRVGDAIMPMTSDERAFYEEWEREHAADKDASEVPDIDPEEGLIDPTQIDPEKDTPDLTEMAENTDNTEGRTDIFEESEIDAKEAKKEELRGKLAGAIGHFLYKRAQNINIDSQEVAINEATENRDLSSELIEKAGNKAAESGLASIAGKQLMGLFHKALYR